MVAIDCIHARLYARVWVYGVLVWAYGVFIWAHAVRPYLLVSTVNGMVGGTGRHRLCPRAAVCPQPGRTPCAPTREGPERKWVGQGRLVHKPVGQSGCPRHPRR